MKLVVLAGGFGTRLSEETHLKPKPMVEIGGKPILWHILKLYSSYGINEFIICCGYKSYLVKEYFANYFLHNCDVTFNFHENNKIQIHERKTEPWKVTLIDTGESTQTGGRLKRVQNFLEADESFCFTYGDGLSNVNIDKLIKYHNKKNRLATMTAVQPPGRYGALKIEDDLISNFQEKPDGDNAWINGGFFVLKNEVINLISGDNTSWEEEVLPVLAKKNELVAFKHKDFWQPMDTLRDKNKLEELWQKKVAPWKKWD
ncbi:glucose-1-phosphate cytidylyltransferase [Prochlorococcus marinus]|uniref:glucose-1-phosphate cytidylyltransferase n=1 Tax=Prochlorococcus marinus TaxID=1219 RepID=UPI001ADD1B08|nr:glucose-1-phosphate cytidylyltransferase [Prochlorococcus marinus]MBO8217705.1 glucose-1-phosphate cytidylyltransferase [Prochlorococcus marinus XMU1405]MBW3040868.1 glucose-1-phosphate cytidylyltransferase [Prochlorococcus marinus str. MU1405]MBW3048328.1 glucose-1-phosphate cytidylyltransferase [Prochlorococcus marinus str. MU1406]